MILSQDIPLSAKTFIQHCTSDVLERRYATSPDGYLEYLILETEKRNKQLLEYVRVIDRESGQPRFSADADHIIPKSVWGTLMFGFLEPGRCGTSFNVLSNLFWRDRQWNRKEDDAAIHMIKNQARSVRLGSPEGIKWRKKWIGIFLRTKHDEGVLCTAEPIDPFQLDQLTATGGHSNWLNRA